MLFVGGLWPLFVRPHHDYESTADSSCFVSFLFFSGEDRSCTVLSFGFELYYYDYVPTVVIFRDEGNRRDGAVTCSVYVCTAGRP